MKTILQICAAMTFAASGISQAQVNTPPTVARAEGVVSALSASSLTLSKANGATETIALLPSWTAVVSKTIPVDQIEPGSYVATANKEKPDGTGVSIEIRVYPPGPNNTAFSRVMDPAAQTVMTNGTVATVVKSVEGRVLEVDYGAGVRKITVPQEVPVYLNTPGDRSMVKVGQKVKVATFAASADRPARQSITIDSLDLK